MKTEKGNEWNAQTRTITFSNGKEWPCKLYQGKGEHVDTVITRFATGGGVETLIYWHNGSWYWAGGTAYLPHELK